MKFKLKLCDGEQYRNKGKLTVKCPYSKISLYEQ